MNNVSLRLLKAPANISLTVEDERIPSDFFDPLARKQSEFRVAMMLINCLNSYIKTPLFPDKFASRRTQ